MQRAFLMGMGNAAAVSNEVSAYATPTTGRGGGAGAGGGGSGGGKGELQAISFDEDQVLDADFITVGKI